MSIRVVLALGALATGWPLFAQPSAFASYVDLEYARPAGIPQRLDLHVPDGAGPWPLLVFIHGGGWQSGDKTLSPAGAQLRQASRGYAVASVNYRLSGVASHPAQVHDCKAAIRWLRLHAAEYRLDPERVGVWGSSAGGHLAALVGTSADVLALEGEEAPGSTARVRAVVDWYGPSDFPNLKAQALPCSGDHSTATSPEGKMLGCAVAECPEKAREASPITWVSADDPPFHIVHGTNDCTVPPLQSETLHEALLAAGVDSSLTMIAGAGHGGPQWTDATNLPRLEAFLDRNVRDAPTRARWIVPSVARSAGLAGTSWRTSLTLVNRSASAAEIEVRFLGHDVDGRSGPATTIALEPGGSVTREDVLSSLFGLPEGWGALLVSSPEGALVLQAQTFTPAGAGTFGHALPAFGEGDLVREGRSVTLAGVREDGAFRTNLVLANATESPLVVDVVLVSESGSSLATRRYALPPLGMTQSTRAARELGATGAFSGRLVLSTPTPGGAFAAYAALVDESTGDPRTLLPR